MSMNNNTNTNNLNNVNNLNVFTFIKEIYQSLKHIDHCFNKFNTEVNSRLVKLEDNQQIVIDKLAGIETLLLKMGENNKITSGIDKNLEFELLEKMKKMNQNTTSNDNYRIELKPEELTFANILENGYTFSDINSSLLSSSSSSTTLENSSGFNSCSSGSNYYSKTLNTRSNDSFRDSFRDGLSDGFSSNMSDSLSSSSSSSSMSDGISNGNPETLNSLLF